MATHPEDDERWKDDEFVSTEELVRRQGVRPITSVDDLASDLDPFGSDEEHEAFLTDLYASRHADIA